MCARFPAWEGEVLGCIEVVFQLKVKRGISACFTQPCSILCLQGVGSRAVGISVEIEIHLHTCVVGEWAVGIRGPTVRTRRITDVVAGLQGLPEAPELP